MPVVAIVGRPNVGKSTLFNRIAGKRQALVDDFPGVTRDRNYARVTWDETAFTLVDTAGFVSSEGTNIEEQAREQVLIAAEEADVILFVADAKAGLLPEDAELVNLLRRTSKPVLYSANKVDGPEQARHIGELYGLGVERIYPISAAHGFGLGDLMSDIVDCIPSLPDEPGEGDAGGEIRVSVIGRPNVGKSTLVNRILGEPRVLVSPVPGTTRDAVDSPFEQDGRRFVLIDTAGIRRKGKTTEKLEKLSILKALQSIDRSHVAVLVVDALEGLTDQDLHIAGYIQERYRGCVVGINKWDVAEKDPKRIKMFMDNVKDRFRFLPFAPILTFSALSGKKTSKLVPTVIDVFDQYNRRVTTGIVNRALAEALEHHEPPMVSGRSLKFFYATQTSTRPPTFVIFCNRPEGVHFSYERYLTNRFREAFGLDKTPLKIIFRGRQRGEKGS